MTRIVAHHQIKLNEEINMQYLLTIYADPEIEPTPADNRWEDYMSGYFAMTKDAENAGVLRGGNALQDTSTATTVRVRNGNATTTDGPFAETKEGLGGYYLLDCEHLDDAISWAKKIPGVQYGSVEIRPIMEFD